MCHLSAHMLDDGCIDQFLRCHLPRCDCPCGALRAPNELHAALMPVREILRAAGVISRPPPPAGPIAGELNRCDAHMSNARGLAVGTRRGRLRIVERLLLSKFAGRPVVVSSLLPEDVRKFIVDQLQGKRLGVLLHQAVQRGLLGAVALVVDRGAIGYPVGTSVGLHGLLPSL